MSNPFGTARYGGGGGQQQQQTDLSSQIVNTVKQDMEAVERSGQWIFSCYSPAKDCASVPGMDDISPEELRLECYQAVRAGTGTEQHAGKVRGLAAEYADKRGKLRSPDQTLRQVLVKIYNKEAVQNVGGTVSGAGVFGGGGGGLFGGPAPSTGSGLFGAPAASNSGGIFSSPVKSSVFGGGSNFGSQPNQSGGGSSIFGGGTAAASGGSIFGGATAPASIGGLFGGGGAVAGGVGSIFGGGSTAPTQPAGGSVFGSGGSSVFSSPAPAASPLFGSAATAASPLFGAAPAPAQPGGSVFSPAPSASLFGSSQPATTAATPTGSSIFGAPTQATPAPAAAAPSGSSLFGTAAPASTQPAGGSLFGSAPSSGGLFSTPSVGGAGAGLFSGGAGQGAGLFGKPAEPVRELDLACFYTAAELLSEEEKAAYLAPAFTLGQVPIRPPPRELCF